MHIHKNHEQTIFLDKYDIFFSNTFLNEAYEKT